MRVRVGVGVRVRVKARVPMESEPYIETSIFVALYGFLSKSIQGA